MGIHHHPTKNSIRRTYLSAIPKELEKENARLKRLLAEKELAIDILNEVAKGKF